MVGATPKVSDDGFGDPGERSAGARRALRGSHRSGGHRWDRIALASFILPLSLMLVQCGKAPSPGALAANARGASSDAFEERFTPQFRDRFPTASETLQSTPLPDVRPRQTAQAELAPYLVASLEPQAPSQRPAARDDLTTLVSMKSSAFPYFGNNPASEQPFLNIAEGDRRGHRSLSGRVYWQDQTYNDNRVLVHVPENFDVRKPGVIVVFFHGNGATLERDVRDRQLLPQQITDSGVNAVLLAPQLAVDAADSSAGKFWQPDGFKRFMAESAEQLAKLYGDQASAKAFAKMPIVIVGYSGGFLPTAFSLDVGGISNRVRGVVLLDAVYGQLDKFASWIANNRSAFFVSSYTHYTAQHDQELMRMLRDKGIAIADGMDGPLRAGSVVFVETGEGITHRDYVTQAWTTNPVKDVLVKMAESQSMTRIAAGTASGR
jgi:hypothetical protein